MDDTASVTPSPEQPSTQAGLTKGNITGKVPQTPIRRSKRRGAVKMDGDKKHHVKSLMNRGLISSKSASFNGLKT